MAASPSAQVVLRETENSDDAAPLYFTALHTTARHTLLQYILCDTHTVVLAGMPAIPSAEFVLRGGGVTAQSITTYFTA